MKAEASGTIEDEQRITCRGCGAWTTPDKLGRCDPCFEAHDAVKRETDLWEIALLREYGAKAVADHLEEELDLWDAGDYSFLYTNPQHDPVFRDFDWRAFLVWQRDVRGIHVGQIREKRRTS